jgi:thiazolinyl imide reductase
VLNPLLDILGRALGSLRPWRLDPAAESPGPYRSLTGSIAGVPFTLRVQNQIHPANRDSYAHVLHRIAVGVEGGHLLLVGSQGPVLWCPRMHMPGDVEHAVRVDLSAEEQLDLPGVRVLDGSPNPSTREFVGSMWPAATARVLAEARREILAGADHRPDGQYQLAVCRLTSEIAARLGRVELLHDGEPSILQADRVVIEAAAKAIAEAAGGPAAQAAGAEATRAEQVHNQEISHVA